MPVWDGGKKLEPCEKKERQDTEAIFIDLFYRYGYTPPAITQCPNRDA